MIYKLKPIEIDSNDTLDEIIDKCHDIFKTTIATKTRPSLGDRFILVPITWINNKAEIFWHSSSIEKKQKLDIKPCNNDYSSAFCNDNCISGSDFIVLNNGEERYKCIYRAIRVGWICEVINMYNSHDPRVKYWEKINSKKRNRIYLRYQEDEIDYIVIFEHKSEKKVLLITAYPIFFISAKKDYDRDYQNYLKSLESK